ncbi:Quinone oxidoreductase 1 [Anatilimnocola aggregata]|uniref:Quinone oxidoreductase 1 n=1 Tax=Anatilimnocola aggregata TaxID=2528021 RepID=A0A517YBJ4_9BACT|nr:NADPH:quinone reductase [Anatilimnocola aggregata]QDU27492.1 Quinone oxidoreductase 1 [Anatilimnocola aggregata]
MKAAYIERTGPPDVIQFGDLPQPKIGPAQVLVKVGAVAVNPIDTYIRNGANYWPLPQPFIIGSDLAGVVSEVGSQVTGFNPGDRVWASNQGLMGRQGCFAEYCAVDAHWLQPTPSDVPDEAAAASALVGITAHLGLFNRAAIKAGESLFVNGGSGGVGSIVVQMAKAAGARVIATAGSAEKMAAVKALGADEVLNYKSDDIAAAIQAFSPGGVNVYWETTREPDFEKIVPLLAERGRLLLMAGRDARPAFPVGPFYVKGCSLLGFVMFKATPAEQRIAADDINRWLSSGLLKPHIGKVLPLAQAAEAHRLQEENTLRKSNTLCGKIVLKP